jgi:hypothetical protein
VSRSRRRCSAPLHLNPRSVTAYNGCLQAGNFAKTSSSRPADGRAVASPEDGRVPCSQAGRDNVAPLYNPPRSTGRALGSRANNSYSRHTKDFCAPNPSPPLLPASLFALAPNPSPSPAYSARVGSKRRAARCGGGEKEKTARCDGGEGAEIYRGCLIAWKRKDVVLPDLLSITSGERSPAQESRSQPPLRTTDVCPHAGPRGVVLSTTLLHSLLHRAKPLAVRSRG